MKTKMKIKKLPLSRYRSECLGGFASKDSNGKIDLEAPESFLPNGSERTLYILDELTSASEDMLAAAQDVLLSRRIGSTCYPNIFPIAICNPSHMAANGVTLPAPLMNRVAIYNASSTDWLDWVLNDGETKLVRYAKMCAELDLPLLIVGPPGCGKSKSIETLTELPLPAKRMDDREALKRSGIAAYLEKFPDMTEVLPKDDSLEAWPSGRSWTECAHAIVMGFAELGPLIVGAKAFQGLAESTNIPTEAITEEAYIIEEEIRAWRAFKPVIKKGGKAHDKDYCQQIKDFCEGRKNYSWLIAEQSRIQAVLEALDKE